MSNMEGGGIKSPVPKPCPKQQANLPDTLPPTPPPIIVQGATAEAAFQTKE